jgi:two-component system, CitB family, sensor kinase
MPGLPAPTEERFTMGSREPANHRLWSGSTDRWSLSARVLGLMAVVVLLSLVPAWWLTANTAASAAHSEAVARAKSAVRSLADSPWLVAAATAEDPSAALAAPIEQIRADNDSLFIVVMDSQGHRWTRSYADQSVDIYLGSVAVAQAGEIVAEDYVGTLGRAVRVVGPVRPAGGVVALVAAGVSLQSVSHVGLGQAATVLLFAIASLALGLVGAWAVSRQVHRQTRGLGPLGLSRLYSYYEAVLHSVQAGLVLVGNDRTVVLCNDEARRLVGTPEVKPGQHVADLWLDPELQELMISGRDCDGESFVEDGRVLVVTQKRAAFEGEDLGWVTTLRDRTDLVRLSGEVDSLRSFSEMLRSRSHEADNRLHTVIMLVELGRGDEAIEFATAAIQQSQTLIDTVTTAVQDAPLAALLLGKCAQAEERGVSLRLAEDLDELPLESWRLLQ